ncbi:hypothetical protein ND748_23320 [Frankia sp. AiPs1]|uniref:hypothetical protein n=1 Tax=Frankia sp. AiPs1 TaxID=573493 RepID=UPI002043CF6B|nr:hypothetical protein [Frankia sp. AiPs1]MCM3924582.1 hypothetical protein [Frankia sp. AiPs1]
MTIGGHLARPDRRVLGLHAMLLRLAGFVPDEMAAAGRAWLGEGRVTDVALSVVHQATLTGIRLHAEDVDLLTGSVGRLG